jgi:hypothetical protein
MGFENNGPGYNEVAFSVITPASEFTRDTFHTEEFNCSQIEGPVFTGHIQSQGTPYVWNAAQRSTWTAADGKQNLTYIGADQANSAITMITAMRSAAQAFVTP